MKRTFIIGGIVAFLVLIMGYGCSTRNKFVDLSEGVTSQWHQVESQYQRRLDLIPNIVKNTTCKRDSSWQQPYLL